MDEPASSVGYVRDLAGQIRAHLPWVERQQAEWEQAHPNADPRASGLPGMHWLLESRLEAVRVDLESTGFTLWESQKPISWPAGMDETDFEPLEAEEKAWRRRVLRPWAGGAVGGCGHQFDAYRQSDGAALHVDWVPGLWPDRGQQAASMCQTDVQELVLLRHGGESFRAVEHTLGALFSDPDVAAKMQAKLPLRHVVLAEL
jgi:hypothetical protein